jgi:hypothetical protein
MISPKPPRTTIGVLIPCTSKGRDEWRGALDTYLYQMTVRTLLLTQNDCYDYRFYIGHDTDDRIFADPVQHGEFTRLSTVFKNISFRFVEMVGVRRGHVTAMWNILFDAAYSDDCDYFYQCGDDIVFHTKNWTRDCIAQLETSDGYGLVGPVNNNSRILTQAFVSRRHMEVFGFFFPEEIINWCCDDWYNWVYHPTHLFPLRNHYCSNNGGAPRYVINNDPSYESDLRANTDRLRRETGIIAKRDREILLAHIAATTASYMRSRSIVVCGCTKNSGKYISDNLTRLYGIGDLFSDFHMVVYENDSSDTTTTVLADFKNTHANFHYITETGVVPTDPTKQHRPQIIAHGRNTLLRYLETTDRAFDYTIMVDLDSVISEFVPSQMGSLFAHPTELWDGLTANCRDRYYDIWALRISKEVWSDVIHAPLWREPIPYDCWVEANRARDSRKFVRDNQIAIPDTSLRLIPVESSFGGFAVYRSAAIRGCRYSAIVDGVLTCEHVAFHRDMRTRNAAKLAICPGFVVAAQPEHMN